LVRLKNLLADRDVSGNVNVLSGGRGYRSGIAYRLSGPLVQFSTESGSSDKGEKGEGNEEEAGKEAGKKAGDGEQENNTNDEEEQEEEAVDLQELQAKCDALEATVAKMGGENADYKDKLIRTLADMENLRERTSRQVENSNKFAIQGFVKDLLDVSDNLERALGAVDSEYLKKESESDDSEEKAFKLLKSLYEGIEMTEKQMLQVFAKNGLERFDPTDQAFDPNLHEARFEVPVPDKEPGTVVVVTKVGYKLHDRVIRPAEVGVVPS
jgi:molecular chaperone GrpE